MHKDTLLEWYICTWRSCFAFQSFTPCWQPLAMMRPPAPRTTHVEDATCVERALGHGIENEVSLHPKSYSHMSVAATATRAECSDDSSEGEMSASGGCDDKHISAAVASHMVTAVD
jgi:hypothetical protein